MAYFYVKSGFGTRTTGGGTTKQTGTFAALGAANVYANTEAAILDGASDDDFICVSSLHAEEHGDHLAYAGGAASCLTIVYVLDTACDEYGAGGYEYTDVSGGDLNIGGMITIIGADLRTDDFVNITSRLGYVIDSKIESVGAANSISAIADGSYIEIIDTIIDIYFASTEMIVGGGSTIVMIGGEFQSSVSGDLTNLFLSGFFNGGGTVKFRDVDLSVFTNYLIFDSGSSVTADDSMFISFDKCKLNASLVGFHNETFSSASKSILVTQSSSSSASAEYQYYFHTFGGTLQDQASSGIHRDESTPYLLSNEKVSLHCLTNSDASIASPFKFKFPTRIAELSTSTDTIRIYFTSTTSLDDSMVYARASYPDATNLNEFNTINSLVTASNLPENPFRTAGSYTDDSSGSTWKNGASDLTGYNEYYMDLDTSPDAGEDCVPAIMVYVTEPSISIYFDTTIDVVGS